MSFSEVLVYLKKGYVAYRNEWKSKKIIVYLHMPNSSTLTDMQLNENALINPHFRIWDREKKTVDAWVPSVPDCLSCDWNIEDAK